MKKVLVAYDGSQSSARALKYVLDLPPGARPEQVHLLNAQAMPPFLGDYMTSVDTEQYRATQLRDGRKLIEPAAQRLIASKIPFESHVLIGKVEHVIAEQAAKLGCDQIVMGTRGMGTVKGMVLGSIATKVLHLAEVPVTLVK